MRVTTHSGPASSAVPFAFDKRAQRNILIAMVTALVAVIAAMSGLNVAQQSLAMDLGASQATVVWIINAYTIVLAALLMPVGAIGDRWGRKPVLITGLVVFGLSNLGAALATSTLTMIVARIFAGAGAAMIMPVTLSVVTSSFPPEDRTRAIGIWVGFAGAGGMIGLFVSSFMVDVLSWRWVFALPLVLVGLSLAMTIRFAPNSREGRESRFDTIGSFLSALAIGGLVLGIHEGPEKGWGHPLSIGGLLVGSLALLAFIVWERRVDEPLLDISAFRDRGLASGSFTLLVVFSVNFGMLLVLMPYFQAVLGWSALRSAAAILPMAVVMMPMSVVAPRLAARIGSRRTMIAGVVIFAAGLATGALMASVDGGYLSVLPGLVLIGLGMGLTMTPATAAITDTLPADKQGVASALNDASREIGGALGVALLGSVLSSGYRASMKTALQGLPTEIVEPASDGIGNAFGVAAQAGEQGPLIIAAAKEAFMDGWVNAMWIGVGIAALAFVYLVLFGPLKPAPADESDRELVSVG